MATLKLLHRETIQDCSVDVNTLAPELKSKVDSLEAKITAYEKKPNENDGKKIEQLSGKLAHEIKDATEVSKPDDAVQTTPVTTEPQQTATPATPVATETAKAEGGTAASTSSQGGDGDDDDDNDSFFDVS